MTCCKEDHHDQVVHPGELADIITHCGVPDGYYPPPKPLPNPGFPNPLPEPCMFSDGVPGIVDPSTGACRRRRPNDPVVTLEPMSPELDEQRRICFTNKACIAVQIPGTFDPSTGTHGPDTFGKICKSYPCKKKGCCGAAADVNLDPSDLARMREQSGKPRPGGSKGEY